MGCSIYSAAQNVGAMLTKFHRGTNAHVRKRLTMRAAHLAEFPLPTLRQFRQHYNIRSLRLIHSLTFHALNPINTV